MVELEARQVNPTSVVFVKVADRRHAQAAEERARSNFRTDASGIATYPALKATSANILLQASAVSALQFRTCGCFSRSFARLANLEDSNQNPK